MNSKNQIDKTTVGLPVISSRIEDQSRKPANAPRMVLGRRDCILSAVHNIDERKRVQEELRHRAFHDELTGLPNRAMFMDTLRRTLHRAQRKQGTFSILFVDLDRFQNVNDNQGHAVGDLLLQAVAIGLRQSVRCTVSRKVVATTFNFSAPVAPTSRSG